MKKKWLKKEFTIGIIILFIGAGIIPNMGSIVINFNYYRPDNLTVSFNGILYVGGSGQGNYSKIQEAIENASDGDTVIVYDGVYYENIIINLPLKIQSYTGDSDNTTIFAIDVNRHVIDITSNNVEIKGFSIKGSNESAGLRGGIRLHNASFCIIQNNKIINNDEGIVLLDNSSNNHISDNYIAFNHDNGLFLGESNENLITSNNIDSNGDNGICFYISNIYNYVKENIITNNGRRGIFLRELSNNNWIYYNNFLYNNENSRDLCTNIWNNSYPYGGNYWNDYNETDDDGDGLGDIPYNISGGNNQDNYPLMFPWGENKPIANFSYSFYGSTVMFNASQSYDRDGDIVNFEWNFGDGTTSFGDIVYYKYCVNGTYNVTLSVTDNDGFTGNIIKTIEVLESNIPPIKPEISGPNSGKPGIEYEYSFNLSSDPDGDDIYLFVEWGDGNSTGWSGPYTSDITIKIMHMWNESGTYTIKAKLKDYCNESDWTLLQVEMPRNKITFKSIIIQIIKKFFSFFVFI
jgi:parallel beta-helix repeat protein